MIKTEAMEVLSRAVYGCYLLTVSEGGQMNGMPLSLFMQAGFKPPLVACGVSPARRTHGMMARAGSFAVNFLRRDQAALVDRFKQEGDDPTIKFTGLGVRTGAAGSPLLDDCLGFVECLFHSSFDPGDHTIFVGEVIEAGLVIPGELLTIQELGKHYGG